jgi:hypothetical protein
LKQFQTVLLIPLLVLIFKAIEAHYVDIAKQLSYQVSDQPQDLSPIRHTAVIPISGIHPGVVDALRYAISISNDVRACYVELDPAASERLSQQWKVWAPQIPLVIVKSPYRSVITPILDYLDQVEKKSKDDLITVIIPEFVTAKWYHQFLHNQTAIVLRAMLRLRRGRIVTSVRHHLR